MKEGPGVGEASSSCRAATLAWSAWPGGSLPAWIPLAACHMATLTFLVWGRGAS